MNKITVSNNDVELKESDSKIVVAMSDKLDLYDILKINIKVIKDTDILIEYKNNSEAKYDIEIELLDNITCNIKEIKEEVNTKVQYKYFLEENSNLFVDKFYDTKEIKELNIFYLNGENSNLNYNFKNIATGNSKYDMVVYHNHYHTNSLINNRCVSINDGNIDLNVTSVIYNGIKGCEATQNNRIINMNDSMSKINPILLIEESDVIANHSAYVGKFNKDILFYMKSRGIDEKKSYELLIKGFLESDESNEKLINKYWR